MLYKYLRCLIIVIVKERKENIVVSFINFIFTTLFKYKLTDFDSNAHKTAVTCTSTAVQHRRKTLCAIEVNLLEYDIRRAFKDLILILTSIYYCYYFVLFFFYFSVLIFYDRERGRGRSRKQLDILLSIYKELSGARRKIERKARDSYRKLLFSTHTSSVFTNHVQVISFVTLMFIRLL